MAFLRAKTFDRKSQRLFRKLSNACVARITRNVIERLLGSRSAS
jgi:hypothetical protein